MTTPIDSNAVGDPGCFLSRTAAAVRIPRRRFTPLAFPGMRFRVNETLG